MPFVPVTRAGLQVHLDFEARTNEPQVTLDAVVEWVVGPLCQDTDAVAANALLVHPAEENPFLRMTEAGTTDIVVVFEVYRDDYGRARHVNIVSMFGFDDL